jgi:hypothetical protein
VYSPGAIVFFSSPSQYCDFCDLHRNSSLANHLTLWAWQFLITLGIHDWASAHWNPHSGLGVVAWSGGSVSQMSEGKKVKSSTATKPAVGPTFTAKSQMRQSAYCPSCSLVLSSIWPSYQPFVGSSYRHAGLVHQHEACCKKNKPL